MLLFSNNARWTFWSPLRSAQKRAEARFNAGPNGKVHAEARLKAGAAGEVRAEAHLKDPSHSEIPAL